MKILKRPSITLPVKTESIPERFFDLYRDGVSQSFINKFLTCKEQCRLEYVEGWTPKKEPIWFTYGKLIHHVLSKCYSLKQIPNTDQVLAFINSYEKLMPPISGESDFQTKEIIFGIAEKIIPIYFIKYADDFKYDHIKNEEVFKVSFPEAAYLNKSIPITGRLDGGFLYPGNRCKILDTKCLSLIDDSLGQMLPFDTQVNLYLWAIKQQHPEYKLDGFIYNIVKRPAHRFGKKESIKEFCDRVATDILSRMDEFFIRIDIPITEKEIQDWEQKFLIPVLIDIERWYVNNCDSYVNGNALLTKYGHCAMFDLITTGDTTNYYKRAKPFNELEE